MPPAIRQLNRDQVALAGSSSRFAAQRTPTTARRPSPAPGDAEAERPPSLECRSRCRDPGSRRGRRRATRSNARRQPRVEPCSPDPKARPASKRQGDPPCRRTSRWRWVPRTANRCRLVARETTRRSVLAIPPSASTALCTDTSTPVRRGGQHECSRKLRIAAADGLQSFDAPDTRSVIAEEADSGADARQCRYIDVKLPTRVHRPRRCLA